MLDLLLGRVCVAAWWCVHSDVASPETQQGVCDCSCLAPDTRQIEVLHLLGEGGSIVVSGLMAELSQALGIHPSHSEEQTLQNTSLFVNIGKPIRKKNLRITGKWAILCFFPHDNRQTLLRLDFQYLLCSQFIFNLKTKCKKKY
jgi:hypothetical protein